MSERKGSIKVETQDIFPIIKKWLYSEHDIFIRELVSNASDAITKRASLGRTQNLEIPAGKIDVRVNPEDKTIKITDNGLGMTEQEVEKYLAQLAFSGAKEFVERMKDEGDEKNADVIGKFGLGFYSAFMVAEHVEVDTLSMNEGAKPVKWSCKGETEYTFDDSEKTEVGTTVTLYVNKDGEEFLTAFKLSETLRRFCDFMPYPISVLDETLKAEKPKKEDGSVDESAEPVPPTPTIVNETKPLWKRDPKEITDDEYKAFYREKFPMDGDPLFWIHLKVDHPFTLEGILYFPKFNPQKTSFNERNIKLYCKQVFVSDDVKNIIPDFLSLLKGCIDSNDIPLNVSRSSLQGDPNIRRISNYVIKKVAESLKKLAKNDREHYEKIWGDIGIFVKYGCISDTKFDEMMRPYVIFKNSEGKYQTLSEYRESIPDAYKEKLDKSIVYFEKEKSDASLRKQLLEEGIQALETDDHIDPHFLQHVEMHKKGEEEYKFSSVDAMISELLETEASTEDDIKIKELFNNILFPSTQKKAEKEETGSDQEMVEISKTKNASAPAYFKTDENMKRFAKMAQSMGQNASFPIQKTLVVNPKNALIQNALKLHEKGQHEDLVKMICGHVQDLATISSEGLKPEEKDHFVKRSQDLVQQLSGLAL
jgi:molecular chaperone HtpG